MSVARVLDPTLDLSVHDSITNCARIRGETSVCMKVQGRQDYRRHRPLRCAILGLIECAQHIRKGCRLPVKDKGHHIVSWQQEDRRLRKGKVKVSTSTFVRMYVSGFMGWVGGGGGGGDDDLYRHTHTIKQYPTASGS